jgi:L-alanine-DL-glutamate epimerase-like enolase superfamily enzyme
VSSTPRITGLRVIPVAGHDGMLLNLSGAHAPFFTRNLLLLTDSAGRTGVGEVPGGEKIRQTLEDARPWVVGRTIGEHRQVLQDPAAARPAWRARLCRSSTRSGRASFAEVGGGRRQLAAPDDAASPCARLSCH